MNVQGVCLFVFGLYLCYNSVFAITCTCDLQTSVNTKLCNS